ncbi:hypothetical protein V6N11_084147 [Hibiscus sabdariffa]|uniref:Uncharacterized protein n=1 Tax=Hibiscus sabdariffa TaxID=183260 RepID=A0ABR1ZNP4_9ROSI
MQYNCSMAIMEITTVGESESDLRRVVFKTKSLVVKVVFDKLLQVIKEFDVTTLQDIAIRLTRPFPASKSQEVAVEAVVAVEDETNIELTSEKMSLKENSEKLSLASEEIVDKLATFDENISLEKGKIMKNKGAEMRQNLVKESVELVFNYGAKDNKTLNVQMSELEDTPNVAKVKLASNHLVLVDFGALSMGNQEKFRRASRAWNLEDKVLFGCGSNVMSRE